ncbi:MAG TPA: DUF5685 family protein [Feifaniaceae bacterium]|nr:DUF5685 family protein [Feifaniaceae bacterium]
MFGYVTPDKPELKVRELTQYQAWYCGLCKSLRRTYGQIPRLALDYDCTFFALLLQGISGEEFTCAPGRCGYKPFRKKAPVIGPCEALSYAADINVLLYYYKLADDFRDEKNILAFAGHTALGAGAKKAAKLRPETADIIASGIGRLSELEQRKEPSIDAAADAFANILKQLALGYDKLTEKQKPALSWLSYHMGRWIYLIDAWEDRKKDEKAGSYNPFLIADATKERASFLLYASLYEMENACDLLDLKANQGLIENIIYRGCRFQTKRVLEGVKQDESV